MMRVVIATAAGAQLSEMPVPEPRAGEILVRVRAASLNRIDLVALRAPAGQVVGCEWAGDVVRAGDGVTAFQPGDRVMCTGAAGFADYAVTDAGRACAIPSDSTAYEDAAVLPMALQTMHDALVTNGGLAAGDSVLIHGASSGVGLMGLQIARLLGAGLVIGSSTSVARRARLKEFGADLAIDSADPAWPRAVQEATGGKGVDLAIDQVSGAQFNQLMEAMAVRGRIVNVGRLGGASAPFDFNLHAFKRLRYTGVTFRTRSADEVRVLNAAMLADLSQALRAGQLRLPIDTRFALEDAAAALARMAANAHFGKIALAP